jgi:hypothetical protein
MVSNTSHAWSDVVLGSGFAAGIVDGIEIGAFGRRCPYGEPLMDANPDLPAQIGAIGDLMAGARPYQLAAAQSQGEHLCVHVIPSSGLPAVVRCWGSNDRHQIDTTSAGGCYAQSLVQPPGNVAWARLPGPGTISIAGSHSCAIGELNGAATARRVFCWGADDTKMLGFGQNTNGTPIKVNDLIVAKSRPAAVTPARSAG